MKNPILSKINKRAWAIRRVWAKDQGIELMDQRWRPCFLKGKEEIMTEASEIKPGESRMIDLESSGSWELSRWQKYGKDRIYISNGHRAVGGSKIHFYYDLKSGKFSKTWEQAPLMKALNARLEKEIKKIMG